MIPPEADPLREALALAHRRGMIGGELENLGDHIAHARHFASAWPNSDPPTTVVDLGSGGGLPALVLAHEWPTTEFLLTETRAKRADTLKQLIRRLEWSDRVAVWPGDVQEAAKGPYRGWADVVTARSFAPPSITAECAALLLRPRGVLVVSEPPESNGRWPEDQLATLGLAVTDRIAEPWGLIVVTAADPRPEIPYRRRKAMDDTPRW